MRQQHTGATKNTAEINQEKDRVDHRDTEVRLMEITTKQEEGEVRDQQTETSQVASRIPHDKKRPETEDTDIKQMSTRIVLNKVRIE